MIEVSSEQSRSQFYIYIYAAALCVAILLLLLQQQCCCFLLLVVIVCQMAKFGDGSLNLIPVFVSLHSNATYFYVRLGSTVSHLRSRFAYILAR